MLILPVRENTIKIRAEYASATFIDVHTSSSNFLDNFIVIDIPNEDVVSFKSDTCKDGITRIIVSHKDKRLPK